MADFNYSENIKFYEDRKGKDTLLITLGDSWTHGVGTYSDEILKEFELNNWSQKKQQKKQQIAYKKSYNDFYKHSWANHLANSLNADLINYGVGGSANSASAKRLIYDYDNDFKKHYGKVIVIFLLSASERFSFYKNGTIESYMHNMKLWEEYIKEITSVEDTIKETNFYIKAIQYYCRAKGYLFYYANAFSDGYIDLPGNIHRHTPFSNYSKFLQEIPRTMCKLDQHPNKLGYALIAENMYQTLIDNYKEVRQ